jgi:phosphotransferase system HPr (HPr) family protein
MGMMMLAAEHGCEISIRAAGEDAAEALGELVRLVENGFGES